MSAIRLREAAALLRERAGKATPGRWYADHDYSTITAEPFKSAREAYDRDWSGEDDMSAPFVISEGDGGGGAGVHDADYIATMSPPVAIALADWLDAEYVTQAEMVPLSEVINASFTAVSGVEAGVLQFGRDPGGNIVFQANTFVGALAVADAILGHTTTTTQGATP